MESRQERLNLMERARIIASDIRTNDLANQLSRHVEDVIHDVARAVRPTGPVGTMDLPHAITTQGEYLSRLGALLAWALNDPPTFMVEYRRLEMDDAIDQSLADGRSTAAAEREAAYRAALAERYKLSGTENPV